jgi:hypothetical protein
MMVERALIDKESLLSSVTQPKFETISVAEGFISFQGILTDLEGHMLSVPTPYGTSEPF